MKCKFDCTKVYEILEIAFICFLPISFVMIAFFSFSELSVRAMQTLFWTILTIVIFIFLALSTVRKGVIRADSDRISISRLFFGRNVFVRNVPYENVEYVLCQADAKGTKYGRIVYELVLTVKIKGRNEMNFVKKLKFKDYFPVRQPKKFNAYLDEQPMMKVYNYINERMGKR